MYWKNGIQYQINKLRRVKITTFSPKVGREKAQHDLNTAK